VLAKLVQQYLLTQRYHELSETEKKIVQENAKTVYDLLMMRARDLAIMGRNRRDNPIVMKTIGRINEEDLEKTEQQGIAATVVEKAKKLFGRDKKEEK